MILVELSYCFSAELYFFQEQRFLFDNHSSVKR